MKDRLMEGIKEMTIIKHTIGNSKNMRLEEFKRLADWLEGLIETIESEEKNGDE